MSAKKNIDWDAVEGIDDPRVSLRTIAKAVGCSHAAVEQARAKRARIVELERENANLRRVLGNCVDILEAFNCYGGLGPVAVVMLEEARKVLRG